MARLTPEILKTALPPAGVSRLEIRDDEEKGLIFRVTEQGARSWSLRYVNAAGEHRRANIGTFPALGLARARTEARKLKGDIVTKIDVVGREKEAKAEARKQKLSTMSALADAYFLAAELGTHVAGNARPKRLATIAEEKRVFEKHIKKPFGDRSVKSIERGEIQAFVDKETKRAAGTGRQCRDIVRQMLSYAVRQGLVLYNAAIGVGAVKAPPRDRVLTDAEVKTLWAQFAPPTISLSMGLALRLGMTTLQRGNEVVGMRWSEIDREAKVWTIPAGRMKAKKTHIVPLSALALSILDEAEEKIGGTEFVFQSPVVDEAQMERRGYSRAMNRIVADLKMPRATPHDFRRTGATNITSERIGMPRFIAGAVLAHVEGSVTSIHYDMNEYLPQKRQALDAWAALLESIVKGAERPDNVLPMKRRAKKAR